jgi:outer membrane receptor protein involved in Fe transport
MKKLQELAPTMPGLFVNEGVGLDSMHIRGVGSGINFGFEQMVGQVIDGFFYGRSRFSRVQFLDIERVEILKGPQGALIGKNTSAGVINITSAGPTEEFTAWIMPTYEFEGDEGTTVEGAISGPLSDTLKGRFAYRYDDRDGYVENTTSGQGEPAIDDWSGRTTLLWEPSGTIDITARWMRGRFDRNGKTDQLSQCNAFMLGFLAANGVTGEDCTANLTTSVLATKNGVGNFNNSTTTLDTVGVTINWDLGGHTLTSLTGYAQYEYSDEIEGDRSPVEFFSVTMSEDYEQWSQELRLASSLAGRVDYVAGLFYQHTEQVTDFGINLNMASMLGAPSPVGFSTLTITDQKVDSVAVFGQATWHLSDEWGVTLGGRFTSEDKEASQQEFPVLLYTRTPMTVPPPGLPPLNSHNIAQNRTEDNFSPMFDLQWTPNDDIMIYGSIRRGFKGGGFDHMLDASQADADDQFQFEDEDVTAYEIGAKLTLADGAAQLNLASFRNEFEDMQVSALVNTLSGIAVFNVGNAASATTQGFEIDARWRPSKNLTLFGAMAYLDAEYNQYDGAACYAGQTVAQGCVNGVQAMDGKTLPYASEWAGVANAEYVWSLPGDLALIGFVQAVYASEYSLVPNLDPNSWQESNWKYDARLTLTNLASNKWDLSLVGRNLGDEITSSHGDEMPFIFVGSYFRYIDPPRSIAFQGTWRF